MKIIRSVFPLSSLQSHLSVCSLPPACLSASLFLLCLHYAQRLLPDCTQCSYTTPAMCRSPVRFHPPSHAQDRPSGRTGNPCLFCASQHFSSRNAFLLPVGTLSSIDDGGNLRLLCSIITFLFRVAWKYESAAFLFFMSITNHSLCGVFYCTASHLSCMVSRGGTMEE